VLAVSAIRTNQKSTAAVSLLVPIVALALPIVDTLLAMLRRGLRGRPMFSGDKEHIHHRLLAVGLSHREVVLLLYAVALTLAGLSIAIATYPPQAALPALPLLPAPPPLRPRCLALPPPAPTAPLLPPPHPPPALP